MKNRESSVSPKQAMHLSLLAITVGFAVIGLSSPFSQSNYFAGLTVFIVGVGVASVGVIKAIQAAKA